MLALALGALALSAGAAYLIGAAFVAERGSFLRTKRGVWLLVLLGGSLVLLPPQLIALGSSLGDVGDLGGVGGLAGLPPATTPSLPSDGALTWPDGLSTGAYLALWVLTSVAAFLVGIRIWRAGQPGWRGAASRASDSSAASRVTGLLPLADTLEDALDVLARANLRPRDAGPVSQVVRDAGRRFASSLPPSDGAVYSLVAGRLPGPIAGPVTGLLLEGAGRRGASGHGVPGSDRGN